MPRKKKRKHQHVFRRPAVRIAISGTAEPLVRNATPATFAAVLAAASAGDVIELASGTYTGTWQVSTANLTIKNKAGAKPIIDGGFVVWSAGVTIQGLEILNSSWTQRTDVTGIPFGVEVTASAANCKVINCIIHDTNTGIICVPNGLEATGNLIYNVGVPGNPGQEHSIYTHNDAVVSTIRDNIFAQEYSGWGLHAFGEGGGKENKIEAIGNVAICEKLINFAIGVVTDGVKFQNNELWKGWILAGQAGQNNEDATITGNYIAYGKENLCLDVRRWNSPTVTGNTVIGGASDKLINFVPATNAPMVWDANTYWRLNPDATKFVSDDGAARDFAGWKTAHAARNADVNSTEGITLPVANRIVIRQNPYDFDRAWIVAYNWEGRASIEIDLSGLGLTRGARYVLRQAQDPKGDVRGFVFTGSTVNVSMTGHTVAVPTAASDPIVATTFPTFGCWLLEKE